MPGSLCGGAVTFPLRMRQHNESAQQIAEFLEGVSKVSFVAYPGLLSHRGHEIAKKQSMEGYGGMISFGLNTDHEGYNRFVSRLKLITSAVSLGHGGSLIVFIGEEDERQPLYPKEFHNGFLRFSVGLEDVRDILEDLEQALKKEHLL